MPPTESFGLGVPTALVGIRCHAYVERFTGLNTNLLRRVSCDTVLGQSGNPSEGKLGDTRLGHFLIVISKFRPNTTHLKSDDIILWRSPMLAIKLLEECDRAVMIQRGSFGDLRRKESKLRLKSQIREGYQNGLTQDEIFQLAIDAYGEAVKDLSGESPSMKDLMKAKATSIDGTPSP